jgi:hypothetical protein
MIKVNGPVFCERTSIIYLGVTEFKGSAGWLQCFRYRYGISHRIINGKEDDAQTVYAA